MYAFILYINPERNNPIFILVQRLFIQLLIVIICNINQYKMGLNKDG